MKARVVMIAILVGSALLVVSPQVNLGQEQRDVTSADKPVIDLFEFRPLSGFRLTHLGEILEMPGRSGLTDSMLSFFWLSYVQTDLGLTPSQISEMRSIEQEYNRQMERLAREFENVFPNHPRWPEREPSFNEARETAEQAMRSVLLPHQQQRLNQVILWIKIRDRGLARLLAQGELGDYLDLSDRERGAVLGRAAIIQRRLEREVAELERQAHDELLATLPRDTQARIRELLGTELEGARPSVDLLLYHLHRTLNPIPDRQESPALGDAWPPGRH